MRLTRGWPNAISVDPSPPPPNRRDIAIAIALAVFAVADIPENQTIWEPVSSISVGVAVIATYWRRRLAVAALAVAFGSRFAAEVASGFSKIEMQATFGHIVLLGVFVYALGRWAKWRDFAVGMLVVAALSIAGEFTTAVPDWTQLFNDTLIWGMLGAFGIAVRYREALGGMRAEQIRSEERERIARDLHDVVAHHVSAIAVQAEGARAVGEANPAAAIGALENIHRTAATTLTEMRRMVGVLRDDSEPAMLTPNSNISELRSLLTDPAAPGPPVQLTTRGDLPALQPSVTSAVLRIAQEAVTNARRHGQNARTIDVAIERYEDRVEVEVIDDGELSTLTNAKGYGIVGMTERCEILGGTLTAEPLPIRGWRVHGVIPTESDDR